MPPRPRIGRKLLIASIGVATVTYVACGNNETSGNLVAPPEDGSVDASANDSPVGNLVAPDTSTGDTADNDSPVGNLIAPPDSGDAGDAEGG